MIDIVKGLLNKWTAPAMLVCLAVAGVAVAGFSSTKQIYESQPTVEVANTASNVYRPSAKDWITATFDELQPLDIFIQNGKVFHIEEGLKPGAPSVAAIPLGSGTKTSLERHNQNYDPKNVNYPNRPDEIVYSQWQGTGPWTFVHLGTVKHDQKFVFEGREFVTRVNADGTRAVKPTGNVLSKVTGVWSEHHEKQLHLTLHFPKIGATNKIITTHEHPFYVPSTKKWVAAADLKVGTDLHTCDGTSARVQKWQEIDEPFTAYNISVENTQNYYVADANNPNAPAVLVHNSCFFKFKKFNLIHSRDTIIRSNKSSYDFWNKRSADNIVESLVNGPERIIIDAGGKVWNGNTRLTVLQNKGYDVTKIINRLGKEHLK